MVQLRVRKYYPLARLRMYLRLYQKLNLEISLSLNQEKFPVKMDRNSGTGLDVWRQEQVLQTRLQQIDQELTILDKQMLPLYGEAHRVREALMKLQKSEQKNKSIL